MYPTYLLTSFIDFLNSYKLVWLNKVIKIMVCQVWSQNLSSRVESYDIVGTDLYEIP